MALTKCPECSNQVSDKAENCPKCGFPLTRPGLTEAHGGKTQTTEKTSKKYKSQELMCALLGIASLALVFVGALSTSTAIIVLGGVGIACAVVWGIAVRVQVWWHHE